MEPYLRHQQPEGIRHVLLDNAANYTKSEVGRRVLEPALGRGLLTSEGETWRRHRRIMAPAFDPRSIAGYAPIMAEVAQALLAEWDALAGPREADVAAAMMHTTLHIISRAMFSSDCRFPASAAMARPPHCALSDVGLLR